MSTLPEEKDNPAHVDKYGRLPAEVKFDKAVYGGISYFAQAATGIVLARWIRDGSGRKYFDAMSRWAGPRVIGPLTGKRGAEAIKAADTPIVVSTMIMVGNTFLIPVKLLENHKPEIVRRWTQALNRKREKKGEAVSPEEVAAQEHHLTLLEADPKQSWGSLGMARAASLAGVYAVLFGIGTPRNLAAERFVANTAQAGMKSVGLKRMGESPTVSSYLRMIFNDGFYSAVSAGGLYVWSHFVCPPKEKPSGEALVDAVEELAEETDLAEPAKLSSACPIGRCSVQSRSRKERFAAAATHSERARESDGDSMDRER